jgi:hypothetical protein
MAREVSWLVAIELLELPCVQPGRAHSGDALLETILADPRVSARLDATEVLPADARERIATTIAGYTGTRAATAEVATGCFASRLGALCLKHATPGMITLGSVLAGTLAQQAAIATPWGMAGAAKIAQSLLRPPIKPIGYRPRP